MEETHNIKIKESEEQIETSMKQLWHFLTEICNKNLVLNNDYIKELLNVDNTEVIQDLSNCMNKFDYLSTNFIENLTNLTQLDLSNNGLKDLPSYFYLLKDLEDLTLNNNKFNSLPTVIGDLKALRSLKVYENYITEVSENIGNLVSLEYLDLSCNKLITLPYTCKKLCKLKYLSLANNKFSKIPDCIITGMCSLETLDLSKNIGITLDIPVCSIHIKKLYVRHNCNCPVFPKWIFSTKYNKLEEVLLDYTVFKKFDIENVPAVSNIKKLSMIECKLSEQIVQMIMRKLKYLENMSIGNNIRTSNCNCFWFLPIEDIEDNTNIKEISAPRTSIPTIPKCINKLVNLIIIDVSFNNINYLPEELCYLKKLQTLIINNNLLVALPDSIGQLQSLKELKANHNQLTHIPRSMVYLNNLEFLDLYNNEFLLAKDINNINMTCLQGLDLEQNYFSTSDLPIAKSHYENLRSAVLEHWSERFEKYVGPKIMATYDEDENDRLSNYTNDSIADVEVHESSNFLEFIEENWDDSDSADEFDPHVFKEPTRRSTFSYYDLTMSKQQFCPADIHAEPIAKRIVRMINNGTLSQKIEFEEGQFDDV